MQVTKNAEMRNTVEKGGVIFMGSRGLDYTALVITAIGALNWGLVGLFRFNLVSWIFGDMSWLSRVIYVIVGICGLYLFSFFGRVGSYSGSEG